jgi:hypothetical protein
LRATDEQNSTVEIVEALEKVHAPERDALNGPAEGACKDHLSEPSPHVFILEPAAKPDEMELWDAERCRSIWQ